MRFKKVVSVIFVFATVYSGQAFSMTPDVFPNFGPEKEVNAGIDVDFRGGEECTDFVKRITGIKISGHAKDWYNNAKSLGYKTSSTPTNNSIGVLDAWKASATATANPYGHVYWVKTATKNGSTYNMSIRHANWEKAGVESSYKTATFRTSDKMVYITSRPGWVKSNGFISKW